MQVSWATIKNFVTTRNVSLQWIDDGGFYHLAAMDGYFQLECELNKNNSNDELADFEANYKANGNKSPLQSLSVQSTPPFGSKTIVVNGVTKSLFARFTGIQCLVNSGSNTLTYTATYPWVKMLGIEVIGGVIGEYASLKIYDTAAGTYSGVPNLLLNQFAYSMNIAPNNYARMAQFDADLYQGMVIEVTYNVPALLVVNRFLGINLLMNEVK